MSSPCVRVEPDAGEATRRALADRDLVDSRREITAADGWLYIPVTAPNAVPDRYEIVDYETPTREPQTTPADLLDADPSYERLGDVVIVDEDDPDRARTVADAVMASDLPVKTVLNRASPIQGPERVREWEILAGNGTETIHQEFGCEFALDLASVYFSPRLATERHRVVEQVDPGDHVLDMFAGVGPFAIPCAARGAEVVAVDINETAIKYLRANADRNDVADRVTARHADVRDVVDDYADWADRLVMNLPHRADEYLETAVTLASDDCVVNYYDIQHEDDPYGPGEAAIREAAEPAYDVTIETRRTVRSYAPHERNVVLDARLQRRS